MQHLPHAVPSPTQDPAGVAALRTTPALDAAGDPALDRLARLAARVTGAPAALVVQVDAGRPLVVGAHGSLPALADLREMLRLDCPRRAVTETGAPRAAPDAPAPGELPWNGAAAGRGVAAYVDVPVLGADGHVLGSLSVLAGGARAWEADTLASLHDLALIAGDMLATRRRPDDARERQLGAVEEIAQLGLWEWDARADTLTWSPRLCKMFGVAPEEAPEDFAAYLRLIHPDDRADVRAVVERAYATGASFAFDHRVRWRDGSVRYLHGRGEVERDAARRPARMRGSTLDVTDRKETELALRASEEQFRVLSAASPVVIFRADLEGRVTYVNPRGERLWQMPAAGLLGHGWLARVHPCDRDALIAGWTAALVEGREYEHEYRLVCPDATTRHVHGRAAPLRDASGTLVGAVGTVEDVTEARRAEVALRESAARLAEAQRVGQLGSWMLDATTGEAWWSAELFALFGREPREAPLSPTEFLAALHPDDRARVRRELDAHYAAGRPYEIDYRVPQRDGVTRVLRERGEPRLDSDGALRQVVGTIQDVTARAAAEAALRETEARLRMALDVAGLIVWERDLTTDRLRDVAVPGVGAGVHLRASELGTYAGFLAAVHPEDRERVARLNAEAVARLGEIAVEYRSIDHDGTVRWNQACGRVVPDEAGRPARMIGVNLDVTERAQLEAQLRQAQKMEAVGQLAGGVAHDFNNLLMVIAGATEFARESLRPDAPALQELAEIDEATRRAGALTRQLLAFSRKQLLKPQLLDVNRVVHGVAPMLRRLIGEDIAVLTILAPALRLVLADPGQLEQVLVNLAVNARDAMPRGGQLSIHTANVEVTPAAAAYRGPAVAPGTYVRLTVRDTGVGMDAATLAQVFEPFFTTKEPGKGTGLGLSTVYGIVKQSGGHVWVSSRPGQGTTFEVDLPATAPEAPATAIGPGPIVSTRGTGTVLLVEDDGAVRALVRRVLTRHGYAVLEAASGREALAVAEAYRARIDVVLTDMVMPGLSGRALAEALAARGSRARVVFMSGYTDDEILRRGLLSAGTALLEKPFTAESLLDAVQTALAD